MQNLRETYPTLIAYLDERGYNCEYIARLKREIEHVFVIAENGGCDSYDEIYRSYAETTGSKQALRSHLTFLGIIECFDLRG
ncbi:MAG: hypothetical protein LBM98_06235, partial [Oscillospiraceae bacterium]|nr:hypothetical protein [Oscillospiraceae bacterium]